MTDERYREIRDRLKRKGFRHVIITTGLDSCGGYSSRSLEIWTDNDIGTGTAFQVSGFIVTGMGPAYWSDRITVQAGQVICILDSPEEIAR